jgi:type I restriction-modification system DNA methylase subunit
LGSANKLRGSVEPAEYKHVVLGFIFLKFAGDKFEEHRKKLIAEGKGKGEFYTPKTIVNLIAEMIEPYRGIIYDPCCGSGGMFVQSMKFIESHHGNNKEVARKDFSLVPSKYIEFVNRDENIDFDEKMKAL